MNLFDTHCHLNDECFLEDIDSTIERAIVSGLEYIMVIGCDRITTERAIFLAEKYPMIYVAAAWHPVDVIDCTESDKDFLINIWQHPKVRAIGETGLDYYWDKSDKKLQQEFFIWHVEKAIENNLPFIVHNRDAHGDTLSILQEMYRKYGALKGIMHSFSGSAEMAAEFLKLGLHISISGVVTFKNAQNVKEVVKITPDNRLLIETDSPYLTPVPFRGKRNEPAYVAYVAEEVAKIKQYSITDLAKITTDNAKKIFKIG